MKDNKSKSEITKEKDSLNTISDKASTDRLKKETLNGVLSALSYTDKEIYDTLPQSEAEEFIELRNRFIEENRLQEPEGTDMPMAAEDPTLYN